MPRQPWSARQPPAVYAVIPAYGGPLLLARALASLSDQRPALRGAIVINNSRDAETDRVVKEAVLPTAVFTPGCNLGTAGGLAAGLRVFLDIPQATHAWILDDDAVATAGALEAMLGGLAVAGADAAMPLLADERDAVRWVPCRLRGESHRYLRSGPAPAEFVARFGDAPRPWDWAIWASLVVSRRAVEGIGFPRFELWSQFSDIEYTLRLTEKFKGVLVPTAVCRHLPGASSGGAFDAKLYSALQNGSYVGLRLPQGRRALRHMPGQNFRYLRHYRWRPRAWANVVTAFFRGAVLGRPASCPLGAGEIERALAHFPERKAGLLN